MDERTYTRYGYGCERRDTEAINCNDLSSFPKLLIQMLGLTMGSSNRIQYSLDGELELVWTIIVSTVVLIIVIVAVGIATVALALGPAEVCVVSFVRVTPRQ